MTGNVSIDLSLENIWQVWRQFRKGKKFGDELDEFFYYLERNLFKLQIDLNVGTYRHGGYKKFIVSDNKRREVSVATVRDRFVHRLIYDYLVGIYDKTFIHDVWSCREGKGLNAAWERCSYLMQSGDYVWKGDVKKFFDSVDRDVLYAILRHRIKDEKTLNLLREVIYSYPAGMPIGNLTSQIFANIYLNELDRFVKYEIKPKAYMRYGDDFLIFMDDVSGLIACRVLVKNFCMIFRSEFESKSDYFEAEFGFEVFRESILWQWEFGFECRNLRRIEIRMNLSNYSSYHALTIMGVVKFFLEAFGFVGGCF